MPARKLYRTDEERREARRRAVAKYDRSEKGRASQYRANHSPKADERYARYRETAGYAASQERYHTSERWREVAKANGRKARLTQPERIKARRAVREAVKQGQMAKALLCQDCSGPFRLDAHHYLGYAPEYWLKVVWLCRRCHQAAHAVTATA